MTLLTAFARLPDPRIARRRRYALGDLLFIALCAVICGANNFVEIELWAKSKQDWLQERLGLQHGIPSHDTLGRVFARLDANIFAECFHRWTQEIATRIKGDVIAIDGKTVRHSFDLALGQAALHLVSAWSCRHHLVLEQEAVRDKSNEITAIPELLYRLDISGCLITIDAMGCQKEIAEQIHRQGGDYCLALKANHKDLHNTVEQFFIRSRANNWKFDEGVFACPIKHRQCQSQEKGHGRIEIRRCFVVEAATAWLTEEQICAWKGLSCVACVESERTVRNKTTIERRYFLTSLSLAAKKGKSLAREILQGVRSHWSIENNLHWVMDVAFREDDSRVRRDNAPANLASLRRLALALVKQDTSITASLKAKRLKAGWDNDYLLALLAGQTEENN